MPNSILPKIIATSVVRAANKGECHGGIYLVDLQNKKHEIIKDWKETDIDWEGRGGDRGLRGIAFHGEKIYLASSNELFIYDKSFNELGSIKNKYLKHCHEIDINNNKLYLSSTGFNSILIYDLEKNKFLKSYYIENTLPIKILKKINKNILPKLTQFDPNSNNGPKQEDIFHINNVFIHNNDIFFSGTKLNRLFSIKDDILNAYADISPGTHNTRPFKNGVLSNNTKNHKITFSDKQGKVLKNYDIIKYDIKELSKTDLPNEFATQAFGRGLATHKNLIIGGSSPSTISVYDFNKEERLLTYNLSKDIRNAIHGLEIWPY